MFEKIMVPLDGSEIAEVALPYAKEIAKAFGSEITLYHAGIEEHRQQEHMHRVYLESIAASFQNMKQANATALSVNTRLDIGDPAGNICNLVEKNNVGLIIMTAVSTSGFKVGKLLGSVADQVCRTVPIPVLLIRPKKDGQQSDSGKQLINRILIPLDGSELSMLALPIGEEFATHLKASMTLYQMARMIRLYTDGYGADLTLINYTQFDEDEKVRVNAEMANLEGELKKRGFDVTHIVNSGFDAASEIIEVSQKTSADLVIMSTHGRSGPGRWVFGNVAERVLRSGETPLLLVHAGTDQLRNRL